MNRNDPTFEEDQQRAKIKRDDMLLTCLENFTCANTGEKSDTLGMWRDFAAAEIEYQVICDIRLDALKKSRPLRRDFRSQTGEDRK